MAKTREFQQPLILKRLEAADSVAGMQGCQVLVPLAKRSLLVACYGLIGVFGISIAGNVLDLFQIPPAVALVLGLIWLFGAGFVFLETRNTELLGRFDSSLVIFEGSRRAVPEKVVAVLPLVSDLNVSSWLRFTLVDVNDESCVFSSRDLEMIESILTEPDSDHLRLPESYPDRNVSQ